jgi:hypothetical protein
MSVFRIANEFVEQLEQRCHSAWNEIADSISRSQHSLQLPPLPSRQQLTILVETVFWASLQREEDRTHDLSIAFSPSDSDLHIDPFVFGSHLDFSSERLAKLAPALHSTHKKIGVCSKPANNNLVIWGFSDPSLVPSLEIRTVDPGKIIVSLDWGEPFKALITGPQAAFIDSSQPWLAEMIMPEVNSTELNPDRFPEALHRSMVAHLRERDFKSVARLMRQHGHGGTLIIVSDLETWKSSIKQPMSFSGKPYDAVSINAKRYDETLTEKVKLQQFFTESTERERASLNEGLSLISQLTAVDGAVIISRDLTLYAFGVKIKPINGGKEVETLLISEPFEGSQAREIPIAELGGTRHQSAAQFVYDQRDSIAVVASQDRRLSIVTWDLQNQKVLVTRHAEFALL